jgi:hypothetical protein
VPISLPLVILNPVAKSSCEPLYRHRDRQSPSRGDLMKMQAAAIRR